MTLVRTPEGPFTGGQGDSPVDATVMSGAEELPLLAETIIAVKRRDEAILLESQSRIADALPALTTLHTADMVRGWKLSRTDGQSSQRVESLNDPSENELRGNGVWGIWLDENAGDAVVLQTSPGLQRLGIKLWRAEVIDGRIQPVEQGTDGDLWRTDRGRYDASVDVLGKFASEITAAADRARTADAAAREQARDARRAARAARFERIRSSAWGRAFGWLIHGSRAA